MPCHFALVWTMGLVCLYQLCSKHVHSCLVKVQHELPEELWTALFTSTFRLEMDTLRCISTERPYSLSFDVRQNCFMRCKKRRPFKNYRRAPQQCFDLSPKAEAEHDRAPGFTCVASGHSATMSTGMRMFVLFAFLGCGC